MAATTLSKHSSSSLSGSVFLITSDGRILNLPIPSRSSRDPLNWCAWKRSCAFLALMVFGIVGLVIIQAPSLMVTELSEEFTTEDMKPFRIDVLVSAPTLLLGIGAFIWIPLSLAVGRRPVFLLCSGILTGATLWAGITKSFYQLLVAVCLQGLASGIATSTMLLMIIDITFIHQRPHGISAFWSLVGSMSLVCLSLVPEVVRLGSTWHTFYLVWTIPSLAAFLLAFFFYPETYFYRPAVAFDGRVLMQSATEKVEIYQDWEEVPGGKALPQLPEKSKLVASVKELRLWGTIEGGWKSMLACYPQILMCVLNPLIFWVSILNAVAFGGMLSIGITYPTLLAAPPYSLPVGAIALVNMGAVVGALLAWPASGIMIARITRRLSMRNGGVRHAEYYLPAFVLPILSAAASVILYGLAGERKWHWIWVYVSYMLNTFGFVGLATANTLWITEAFPRWAAAAVAIVGGGSYVISFGISFAILPWIKSQGFARANIEIGVLTLVVGLVLIPVAFWGKSLRQYIHGRWAINEGGALRPQQTN